MSKVAKLDVKFTNVEAIKSACTRIGANFCGKGFVKFYDETEVGGYVIQLPDWKYPIVIKPDGSIRYDNYNGEWGSMAVLNQFKQYYAADTAKQAAIENNYSFEEEELPTGVLKITVNI